MSEPNGRRPAIRLDVVTLLALLVQIAVLGIWGGRLTQSNLEQDRRLGRLEQLHDRSSAGLVR